MTPTTDTPPKNPAFMLPAEFAEWKAGQHPVDPHAEADASWSAVPVDSDSVTAGAGIPAADLAALIAATVPADAEHLDDERLDDGGSIPCDVIDLDGPDPALTAWQALVNDATIEHGGDAEKVIPFPRPAWADPAGDRVAGSIEGSYYRSDMVHVFALKNPGKNDDDADTLTPARARVSATLYGDGDPMVSVSLRAWNWVESEERSRWVGMVVDFMPAEARELAAVLLAAAALAESEVTR